MTTTIEQQIGEELNKSFQAIYGKSLEDNLIQVQKTKKDFDGDFTIVVFPLLRLAGGAPEAVGNQIGEHMVQHSSLFTGFNVVKGFLNLEISNSYFIEAFSEILGNDEYGKKKASGKTLMVEFSSPNTNKPLHLGHLRNIFLGYSVSKILEANGHEVLKVQIINDRGIHICKSMLAWQKFGKGETPESSGLKGDKLVGKYYVMFDQAFKSEVKAFMDEGKTKEEAEKLSPMLIEAREMLIKWENHDPEVYALWEKMNRWVYEGFEASYETMGVSFDKLYYESNTYIKGKEVVDLGLEKGVFYRKEDGSVWCDLTEDGLDEKLVLRKDGTAVYMTQDIGTAILRFEDFENLSAQIYTVGNEQEYHFKVLFLILEKLGFKNAKNNYHLSYGMVELPEGKMKSREGTVVDADDIMHEMEVTAENIAREQGKLEGLTEDEKSGLYHMIGIGALKYFLLRVDPRKNMMFNPEESIDFNGNTGPFIQYGYVRTRSILRKYGAIDLQDVHLPETINPTEKGLIVKMMEYPEVIESAGKSYDPSGLSHYCFELVKTFNAFYQATPILREEDEDIKKFRVLLSITTGAILKSAMEMLGIGMPERM